MSMCGTTRTDAAGAPVSSLASWTWSQEGLAPCMRTGWPSAANCFAPVSRSRRWIPSRDSKNAIDDQLQDATSVLDAFHIVKLAGDALDEVRRRVQQDTTGHRGRKGDPLYQIRNLLRASRDRLTKRQKERLREAFTADEAHISVEVAYLLTQQVRDVFHQDTPAQGQRLAARLIESLPACSIPEIARLGRTLRKWKDAFLAYFDTGGASNGPTEAINGIIELGRRAARGYRNPTNYQLRMLLIAGGLDASTHTQL